MFRNKEPWYMYITVSEMVHKRLYAWVYAQVCMWVWTKEGSKWGLNGNNKWIWVKVYGYSLYCFYSCYCSISLHYFQIKSSKNFLKIFYWMKHCLRILSTAFISSYFGFELFHLICWLNTKLKAIGSVFL